MKLTCKTNPDSPFCSFSFIFSLLFYLFDECPNAVTGYERDQTIKNLSAEEVRDVLQEMRDTLGRKVPRHSQIANRVVEQKKISVQGVWRNSRDLDPDLPAVVNRLKELQRDYGLHDLVNEMGITGIVQATQMIIRRKDAERQAAMAAAFPRRKRVAPSE